MSLNPFHLCSPGSQIDPRLAWLCLIRSADHPPHPSFSSRSSGNVIATSSFFSDHFITFFPFPKNIKMHGIPSLSSSRARMDGFTGRKRGKEEEKKAPLSLSHKLWLVTCLSGKRGEELFIFPLFDRRVRISLMRQKANSSQSIGSGLGSY